METYSVAKAVKQKLDKIPDGKIFGYDSFPVKQNEEMALAKMLSRLTSTGVLVRAEKGKYYKPQVTKFGKLQPSEKEFIDALTIKDGQRVGYITGNTLFNNLGLTTQVPGTITIASRKKRLPRKINGYTIKFVTTTAEITEQNIYLLQLLDVVKNIQDIPDTSIEKVVYLFIEKIEELGAQSIEQLIQLALNYNPSTRALLGCILEQICPESSFDKLFASLNAFSSYKLGVAESVLPNQSKWNIK